MGIEQTVSQGIHNTFRKFACGFGMSLKITNSSYGTRFVNCGLECRIHLLDSLISLHWCFDHRH